MYFCLLCLGYYTHCERLHGSFIMLDYSPQGHFCSSCLGQGASPADFSIGYHQSIQSTTQTEHTDCNQTGGSFQIRAPTSAQVSGCCGYHTSVEPVVPGFSSPPSDVAVSPSPVAPSSPASVPPASSSSPPLGLSSLPPLWQPADPLSLSVVSVSLLPAWTCSPAPPVAISSN